ncbi:DNA glycosylase AlkZ-like family protein [Allorhizocola rhizosphaerae]|uniref:DNA glycosylase AlkZ-like family protein n=1 Tax=Allorhizocola rhizosphaerae TaxID=1872709 RepID=UPI001FE4B6F9|nr:crosslink repair DNA glycosylase YcaQ family protein [Allorhizocola rhizosphaerae]
MHEHGRVAVVQAVPSAGWTLARQMLLERSDVGPLEAISHLVGLRAEAPQTWFVGLWTRLRDFAAVGASRLLEERKLVRIALMRSAIHLVTASDVLDLRVVTPTFMVNSIRRGPSARHIGRSGSGPLPGSQGATAHMPASSRRRPWPAVRGWS